MLYIFESDVTLLTSKLVTCSQIIFIIFLFRSKLRVRAGREPAPAGTALAECNQLLTTHVTVCLHVRKLVTD